MPSSRHELEPRPVAEAKQQSSPARATKKRKTSETPPVSEEQASREAFLARNRQAATKSRQKKREWTQTLEENLRNLQARNKDLKFQVGMLKQDIVSMKSLCLQHFDCDCASIRTYMNQTLANILTEGPQTALSPAHSIDFSASSSSEQARSREASHESFRMEPPTAATFHPQLPAHPHHPQNCSPTIPDTAHFRRDSHMTDAMSSRHNSMADSMANDDVFSTGNHPSSASDMSPIDTAIDPALCDVNLLGEAPTDADLKAVWDQLVGDDFDPSLDHSQSQMIGVHA